MYLTSVQKISFNKLFTFLIAIFPLINIYSSGFMPLGDIIISALCLFWLLTKRKKYDKDIYVSNKNKYMFFIMYVFVTLPLLLITKSSIGWGNVFTKSIHILMYTFIALYFVPKIVDFKMLKEIVVKVTIISSYIIIIQELIGTVFNKFTYLLLPFMKYSYIYSDYSTYIDVYTTTAIVQGYRASGFFLEPSHACSYLMIGFVLLLFDIYKPTNKRYYYIILTILAILCTLSTSGIITAGVLVVLYMFINVKKQKKHESYFKFFLLIAGIIGMSMVISSKSSQIVYLISSRIGNIGTMEYASSGNIRVLRGLYVWNELPTLTHIIGTGNGCLLQDIINARIKVLGDIDFLDDMNLVFYVLNTFGVLGFIAYFRAILSNIRKSSLTRKMMIFLFMFTGTFYNCIYHAISVLYLSLIFIDNKKY